MAKWISVDGKPPAHSDNGIERWLLRGFAKTIANGSFTIVNKRKKETLGLYWEPRSPDRARRLVSHLSDYFAFLAHSGYGSRWSEAINQRSGRSPLGPYQQAAAAAIRLQFKFLAHLGSNQAQQSHSLAKLIAAPGRTPRVYSFPSKHISSFLFNGFSCETARLIAFILFAGGLRTSEPLHLFMSDIQFSEQRPELILHHPRYGRVINRDGEDISREEHLASFGMTPRNVSQGRFHSGWKGLKGDREGTPAYWLPIPFMAAQLGKLLTRYILQTRPMIMAARRRSLADHPFLFVNSGRTAQSNEGEIGDPYTMSAFQSEWNAAVNRTRRLSKDPMLTVRKANGTTPHGARHFYGRYLKTLRLDGAIIADCMHHRSILSHLVYTQLTPSELSAELNLAAAAGSDRFQPLRDEFVAHLGRVDNAHTTPSHWR
ncbi:hypothetical protein [Neorhizobium sp. SOG26]|uniref:hypothetical protein n=1 Tax=Neorhizobium sp. SOG26 TaxID=2060726 RepID=UPI001900C2D1|nr:hypothetical protein [Neorhizobium sp. SOG26]